MNYPPRYLRGISSQDQFDFEGGIPTNRLFPFQSGRQRPDGWIEESISWLDEDKAVQVTLAQVKDDGEKQFEFGLAVMKQEGLNYIKAQLKQVFKYNRAPLPNNKYHGNLLVNEEIKPRHKKLLSAWLAVFFEQHIPQPSKDTCRLESSPCQQSMFSDEGLGSKKKRSCFAKLIAFWTLLFKRQPEKKHSD